MTVLSLDDAGFLANNRRLTVSDTLRAFATGRTKNTDESRSLYICGNELMGNTTRFGCVVLAYRSDFGNGIQYLIDADGDSVVQRSAREALTPNILIPFSALYSPCIDPLSIQVLDTQPERTWTTCGICHRDVEYNSDREYVHTDDGTRSCRYAQFKSVPYNEWKPTMRAVFGRKVRGRIDPNHGRAEYPTEYHHLLGAVLFRSGDRTWLSATDANEPLRLRAHFLSPIIGEPCTIAEAYQLLKPQSVIDAEQQGLAVRRQGDVFFIPLNLTDKDASVQYPYKVPHHRVPVTPGGSHYASTVRRTDIVDTSERIVRGRITQRSNTFPYGSQHAQLLLGKTWHRPVLNTSSAAGLRSYGATGRVD